MANKTNNTEIYILFSGSKKLLNTLKKREVLIHATTWKNLENIMLSEINQSQKDSVWFHLYKVLRAVKIAETESKMVAAKD